MGWVHLPAITFLTLILLFLQIINAVEICVTPSTDTTPSVQPCGIGNSTCCHTIPEAIITLKQQVTTLASSTVWLDSFTVTQRLELLHQSVHTIRLSAGTYECDAGGGGWFFTQPVHILGEVDASGVPTTIIDCTSRGGGRIFRVREASIWLTNLQLKKGANEGGSALFVEIGYNNSRPFPQNPLALTDGSDLSRFPPFGLIHDLQNVRVLNHATLGPGAVALRYQADTSNYARFFLRGCVFQGNRGGSTTTIDDGAHAGAISITYNGDVSQSSNQNIFEDSVFIDNQGGSDFSLGAAVGAGAIAINLAGGGVLEQNRMIFRRCQFLSNAGGNRIVTSPHFGDVLEGFSIGAGAIAIGTGSHSASYNEEIFESCTFRHNRGGEGNSSPIGEGTGAGAITINYVPYSDCTMAYNRQSFSDCVFDDNTGGNENNNVVSTYGPNQGVCIAGALAGGGAGAVSIQYAVNAYLADPTLITQDLQSINRNQSTSISNNTHEFIRCEFINNSGGSRNNHYQTPCPGGGGGAGGIFLLYMSTSIYGEYVGSLLEVRDSIFRNNTGGEENNSTPNGANTANGGGGAGAVNAVFLSATQAGLTRFNTQRFTNSKFLNNRGGNFNGVGTLAGSAGGAVNVLYFQTSTQGDTQLVPEQYISFNTFEMLDTIMSANVGGFRNQENTNGGSAAGALAVTWFSFILCEMQQNVVTISRTNFTENSGAGSQASYGALSGAVALTMTVYSGRTPVMDNLFQFTDCHFLSNLGALHLQGLNSLTANSGGLAVVLPYPSLAEESGNNQLVVTSCTFDNHASSSGSALWAISTLLPFRVTVSQSSFTNNRATEDGAAMRLSDAGQSFVGDSAFTRNSANSSGGAVLVEGRMFLHFLRTTFNENSAIQFGGEVVIQSPASIALDNCTMQMASGYELQPQQSGIVFASSSAISDVTGDSTTDPVVALTYDNYTTFGCGPGNVVYSTPTSFGCQFCRTQTYSLSRSIWVKEFSKDMQKVNEACIPCEFGADCSNGGSDIRAVVGYWGSTDTGTALNQEAIKASTEQTRLSFTLCLASYCCTPDDASASVCSTYNTCAPHRIGRLCGQCDAGYSETLGSDGCTENGKCNAKAWFFPVAFIAGLVLAILIAYQGSSAIKQRYQDAAEHDPDSPHPVARTPFANSISLLIYFFQLAGPMYLSATTTSSHTSFLSGLFSALRNLFEFTPSTGISSGGVCLWPDMTSVQKQSMYMSGPLFILIPFVVGFAVIFALKPFVPKLRQIELGDSPIHLSSVLLVGLVKIGLFGYSTFIRRLLILVHCVPVGSEGGTYMLQNGEIECYQPFQVGAAIALACICLYPPLFIYWLRPRREHLAQNSLTSFRRGPVIHANLPQWKIARARLVDLLTADFHPRYRYWEGALLFYRLAVALCSSLINNVLIQFMILFFLNLLMLSIHITIQPFRFSAVQDVQTVCLMMLTIISTCSLPTALMISLAVNAPEGATGTEILAWVQFFCLTLCGFICLGVLLYKYFQQKSEVASRVTFSKKLNGFVNGNGSLTDHRSPSKMNGETMRTLPPIDESPRLNHLTPTRPSRDPPIGIPSRARMYTSPGELLMQQIHEEMARSQPRADDSIELHGIPIPLEQHELASYERVFPQSPFSVPMSPSVQL